MLGGMLAGHEESGGKLVENTLFTQSKAETTKAKISTIQVQGTF